MLRDEGGIDDRRGGGRGRDGDGDDGLRDEEPVLSDGGDEGGDAHRVGRLCNGQGSLHAQLVEPYKTYPESLLVCIFGR